MEKLLYKTVATKVKCFLHLFYFSVAHRATGKLRITENERPAPGKVFRSLEVDQGFSPAVLCLRP